MLHPFGFYLLRQPHWSIDELLQLQQNASSIPLAAQLRSWYASPLAQQALCLASPALYERFQQWFAGAELPEGDKFIYALYKYAIRMSTRCTPYGLFAGCSVGQIASTTHWEGVDRERLQTHTRLDVECLFALKDWLTQQPVLRSQLRVYPCTSLYTVGDSYRYVEPLRVQQQRQYFISAVEKNEFLDLIFEQARQGATLPELMHGLSELGIEPAEAEEYLDELLSNHLLVFEIEPTLTGTDYLNYLIERLQTLASTQPLVVILSQLQGLLRSSTDLRLTYEATRRWLDQYDQATSKPDIIQVDAFHSLAVNQLQTSVVEKITKQLSRLMVLHRPYKNPELEAFKRRFYNRYEDEEVPLALALDHEIGVGYGQQSPLGMGYAPMVDDLSLPSVTPEDTEARPSWWQDFLLEKFSHCLSTHQREIQLSNDDLAWIGQHQLPSPRMAHSFYVLGSLLAASEQALDQGDFQFSMAACSGPSAVNLLSRFCEGSATLTEQVRACVAEEERFHADVIFAEIVYCPDSRAGNILTRPALHTYEIPYMGQSSLDPAYQIPLEDLRVSLQNQQVILRSQRLNKRVIPRLSNAHNYQNSLPLYRFLCDLQSQDTPFLLHWDWSLLKKQAFLPRVSYENIIISRARWALRSEECASADQLTSVLKQKGLPDFFVLASGDNELLINAQDAPSLQLLWLELRKQGTLQLLEFLSTPEQCPVSARGLKFTHELILPFYNTAVSPIPGLSHKTSEVPQRRFSIGSEWLYLKVYIGEKSSDLILIQSLYPVIRQLLGNHIIRQFFFVRYKDPDPHLRLRFLGNPHLEFYHHVIRAIEQVLRPHVQTGLVHRIQTDTYQRELERYGMQHMEHCETIFHYDSLTTLSFLEEAGIAADESLRFVFATRQIDQLLTEAGLTIAERHELMSHLNGQFFQEFSGNPTLRKQLNDKYRLYRPLIEQQLNAPREAAPSGLTDVLTHLNVSFSGKDQRYHLLASFIHMMINRIFPTKQRAYELIVYASLTKYYDSARAKQRMVPTLD